MISLLLSILTFGGNECGEYFIYESSLSDNEMTIYVNDERSEVFFGHTGGVFQTCDLFDDNFCVRESGLIIADFGRAMLPGDRISVDGYEIEYRGNSTLTINENKMLIIEYSIFHDNELIFDVSFGRAAGLRSVHSHFSGNTYQTICEVGAFAHSSD